MSYIRSHPTADNQLYQSIVDTCADPPTADSAIDATPQTAAPERRSLWRAVGATLRTWQACRRARRDLSVIDARSLRELGLSPELVAYELRRPFWRPLRDWRS